MVEAVRMTEEVLGTIRYRAVESEASSKVFQRSLFVVQDIRAGEVFSTSNLRSIRPGYGLHTRHLDEFLGRRSSCDIERGTPLSWRHLTGDE